MKEVNVAIIGTKFMGKAHSNAWLAAPRFFKVGLKPVLKVACGQDPKGTKDFADNWGWQETATSRHQAWNCASGVGCRSDSLNSSRS